MWQTVNYGEGENVHVMVLKYHASTIHLFFQGGKYKAGLWAIALEVFTQNL